jgi:hypothetical protein
MKKPLNVVAKTICWICFLNRKILAVHLINYIDLNDSLHHVNNVNCLNYDKSLVIIDLTLSMDWLNLSTPTKVTIALIQSSVTKFIHPCSNNKRPYPKVQLNLSIHVQKQSPLFTNVTKYVHPCPNSDLHCLRMQLNLSTLIQEGPSSKKRIALI